MLRSLLLVLATVPVDYRCWFNLLYDNDVLNTPTFYFCPFLSGCDFLLPSIADYGLFSRFFCDAAAAFFFTKFCTFTSWMLGARLAKELREWCLSWSLFHAALVVLAYLTPISAAFRLR